MKDRLEELGESISEGAMTQEGTPINSGIGKKVGEPLNASKHFVLEMEVKLTPIPEGQFETCFVIKKPNQLYSTVNNPTNSDTILEDYHILYKEKRDMFILNKTFLQMKE